MSSRIVDGMAAARSARTDGRASRWDEHRTARRQELIGSTVIAVRELGAGVGMEDIARRAGVSKQVFYRYFADKADLHLAVGRAVAEMVVDQVARAIDEAGPVWDRVAAGIDCYLRLIERDPELYRYVVHGAPPSRHDTSDPVEDYATVVGLQASKVLAAALREAGGDAGAAEPWGFGIVGMVRTVADRWLDSPTLARADLVAYLADLVAPAIAGAVGEALGPAVHDASVTRLDSRSRRAT